MSAWARRTVPLVAAALAVLVANLLEPITDHAWAPAILPAIVLATFVNGRIGGVSAWLVGIAGRVAFITPPPWTLPGWTASWLTVHALAIAATDVVRQAREDRGAARRLQRERAVRVEKAVAERRAEFLTHASTVLASSPNYATTLAAVANLAVPHVADLCVIDIVDEDGAFTPLAIAHVDPRKAELVRELRQLYPIDPKAPFGPARVLRTGRSVIYSDLPTSDRESAVQPSDVRVALALGIRSTLAIPLTIGGRRLGVISFATTDSRRQFVASDVEFAEDLARRAAIAIDTATP